MMMLGYSLAAARRLSRPKSVSCHLSCHNGGIVAGFSLWLIGKHQLNLGRIWPDHGRISYSLLLSTVPVLLYLSSVSIKNTQAAAFSSLQAVYNMINGTLTLVRGDDQDVGMAVVNTDGTPYILSGCSLTFTARRDLYTSPVILQKVVTGHLAPESGLSQLSFVSADTANINDQKHFFDIKLLSAVNRTSTLMDGWFYVKPSTSPCSLTD